MSEPLLGRPSPRFSPLFVGVQLLLVMLAISRYEATSFLFRGTTEVDFYNWFWRHRFLGFLSFFDFLVLALVVLAAAGIAVSGRWRPRPFDALIYGLLAAVAVSAVVRFVQRDVEDTTRAFLFQLRNYVYFAVAYGLTSRLRWTERRGRWFAGLLVALAGLTMALSWWEIRNTPAPYLMQKYGRTVNIRDLSDYLFIFFLQFWAAALLLERLPRRAWLRALLAALLLYSLLGVFTGVGRGVLIVYPAVFVYFAWYHDLFRRRWFVAAVAGTLVVVTLLGAYVVLEADRIGPESPFYVYTTFTGREAAVATRGLELMNFVANLYHRKALLLGIGLGGKWYEFWPQLEEDTGAFPPDEWGTGWHLGLHVPFLRLALDFGIAGAGALLILFGACFLATMRALRSGRLDGATRAFMLSSWAVIGYQVSVNNLAGPKANLIAGLLLGAVSGLLSGALPEERA